jgi:hypothetical protein
VRDRRSGSGRRREKKRKGRVLAETKFPLTTHITSYTT